MYINILFHNLVLGGLLNLFESLFLAQLIDHLLVPGMLISGVGSVMNNISFDIVPFLSNAEFTRDGEFLPEIEPI